MNNRSRDPPITIEGVRATNCVKHCLTHASVPFGVTLYNFYILGSIQTKSLMGRMSGNFSSGNRHKF